MTTLTPERAEIESLRRAICRAENAHAATCVTAHYLRAELEAADAALKAEHEKAVKAENELQRFSGEWRAALEERDSARKALGEARVEIARGIDRFPEFQRDLASALRERKRKPAPSSGSSFRTPRA